MSCSIDNSEELLAYCAGKLDTDAALKLESHLSGCAECAGLCRQQGAVWAALESWQPAEVSADFNRRLYARIDAAESAPWYQRLAESWREFTRPLLAQPALPLAVACLVVVGGFMFDHSARPQPVTSVAAGHVSSVEADQVEAALDDIEMLRQFEPSM